MLQKKDCVKILIQLTINFLQCIDSPVSTTGVFFLKHILSGLKMFKIPEISVSNTAFLKCNHFRVIEF